MFDGMNSNIAARQLSMNIRFAAPSGGADEYEPGSEGVLWWSDYTDETRGRKAAGLLTRCTATATCPKIVETFGSSEFYSLRMSPDLVRDTRGSRYPTPAQRAALLFTGGETRRRRGRIRCGWETSELLRLAQ